MTTAVIVAAGTGTRMGPGADKLFIEVAGAPVVAHTWRRFDAADCIDQIVLVVRAGMEPAFNSLAQRVKPQKPFRLVVGGPQRQDSVWNGLEAVSAQTEIVAIQDAARPCTSPELIAATVQAAQAWGAAVAAQPLTDTLKESADGQTIARHLDRSRFWTVQTPQAFRLPIIRQALAAARAAGLHLTDDTAACELIGQPVRLVPSPAPNPKVTVPADLAYVELLLRGSWTER
jgi:2-C-methyl-D-erythritol 4-phosphate cytidylyltransferase